MIRLIALCSLVMICIHCKKDTQHTSTDSVSSYPLQYAKSFTLSESNDRLIITFEQAQKKVEIPKSKLPISSCWVMNTSSVGFLESLDATEIIAGLASPEYIYSPIINEKLERNMLSIVGNDAQWDFEQMLQSDVRFVFCNYNPNFEKIYHQFNQNGFYLLFIDEYIEQNPLGRTEYIKLFGKLLDREPQSQELFRTIETNYKRISEKSHKLSTKPKLLSKIMYGDIWYMPGGKSYSAQLYEDAGGDYYWGNTPESGALQLTWEEVYAQAQDADIWIDVSDVDSNSQLLAQNAHYKDFEAFQHKNLFALSGRKNGKANDFYESGVVYADKVLSELQYIFTHYSEIQTDSLFYYRQLN